MNQAQANAAPLYDNKRLEAMMHEIRIRDHAQRLYYYVYADGIRLLRQLRDDYEARLAALEQDNARLRTELNKRHEEWSAEYSKDMAKAILALMRDEQSQRTQQEGDDGAT